MRSGVTAWHMASVLLPATERLKETLATLAPGSSIERVEAILSLPPDRPEGAHGQPSPSSAPQIELRNLTFAWPGREAPALKDVSVTVSAGKSLGILGATVMPHNLYLHSAIVQTRAYGETIEEKREALKFATIDSTVVGSCTNGTPRRNTPAANPPRSPTTPPPSRMTSGIEPVSGKFSSSAAQLPNREARSCPR